MSNLTDFFLGSKGGTEQLPTMSGGQQQLSNQVQQMLMGLGGEGGAIPSGIDLLRKMMSGEGREEFEAPYRKQFEEQTMPSLAERYAGAGALGSSGFAQSAGAAGAGLESSLAQLGSQRQMGGLSSLMNLYTGQGSEALNRPEFQYRENPASPGLLGYAGAGFGQQFGKQAGQAGGQGMDQLIKMLMGGR